MWASSFKMNRKRVLRVTILLAHPLSFSSPHWAPASIARPDLLRESCGTGEGVKLLTATTRSLLTQADLFTYNFHVLIEVRSMSARLLLLGTHARLPLCCRPGAPALFSGKFTSLSASLVSQTRPLRSASQRLAPPSTRRLLPSTSPPSPASKHLFPAPFFISEQACSRQLTRLLRLLWDPRVLNVGEAGKRMLRKRAWI